MNVNSGTVTANVKCPCGLHGIALRTFIQLFSLNILCLILTSQDYYKIWLYESTESTLHYLVIAYVE